jgi:hypothetical protein
MHSIAQALRSGQQRPMQNTGMATAQIETKAKRPPQTLISCAFCRKKRSGHKTRFELVGSTKSTKKSSVTPRRHPDFPFDYNENEGLVIGESLDERERKG